MGKTKATNLLRLIASHFVIIHFVLIGFAQQSGKLRPPVPRQRNRGDYCYFRILPMSSPLLRVKVTLSPSWVKE